jgi:spore maturation protein CgeB
MKILCVFGRHQYGDPKRGLSTEYASFVPAFRHLGHEVLHFESWDPEAYEDFAELNERLLETVESFRPDVMFTQQMAYELWLETLQIIKARGDVATVSWAADDSWKYREVSRFIGPAYHAMTTTYDYVVPWYRKDGMDRVLHTQWGVPDDWLRKPMPASECRYQVSFVGAAHGERREQIEKLRAAGLDIACFGHGWPNGPVEMDDIPNIMRQSVISLNFANSKGDNQIKARTFEVPGAGGFLLTESAKGLDCFFQPEKEISVYENFSELVDKIHYYLAHEKQRDDIALAGFERTRREHTYSNRMRAVITHTLGVKSNTKEEALPLSLEDAIAAHRLTRPLKVLRGVLVGALSIPFGQDRSPRAARRLVFELSWRLTGRHTFTAAGWPGRMFYRES